MHDAFSSTGELRVVIGDGYLTAHELGQLQVGDHVRADQIAGDPYTVLYNDGLSGQM